MKAVGLYLIVEKEKQGAQKTEGGLLIAENAREVEKYIEYAQKDRNASS